MDGGTIERGGATLPLIPRLHVVTDDAVLARADFATVVRSLFDAGHASWALHLRGTRTSGRRLWDLARPLMPPAAAAGIPILVNDRVDVAMALGCRGVHLAVRSMSVEIARSLMTPGSWVGASVHGLDEVNRRLASGRPDYLTVGTIFETRSHPGRAGGGTDLLRQVAGRAPGCPLLGIGGIEPRRVTEVMGAGAHGVAVLGGIWGQVDPAASLGRFSAAIAAAPGA